MKQSEGESAMGFLRRVVSVLNSEYETHLNDLPSVQAILDFAELWSVYDTDYLSGIFECIEEGADPKPYKDFVAKHNLPWRCPEVVEQDEV